MLRPVRWLAKLLYWPLKPLVRCKIVPDAVQENLELNPNKPVFYITRTESASDLATLVRICRKLGLPDPMQPVQFGASRLPRVLFLEQPQVLWGARTATTALEQGLTLLQTQQRHPELQAQLVPVSVLWGRAPGKENSIKSVLGESESPSWLAKLFIVLISGRHTLVRFSLPVSVAQMVAQTDVNTDTAHKLLRVARVHFFRQRLAATGPKLPDRSALFNALLASDRLKQAIEDEAQSKHISVTAARAEALKLLQEIAADYRESTLRLGDRVLGWLWQRLYNGIVVNNSKVLTDLVQKGHEIVYVPCHRSHMDYLLLSYVIYHQGLAPPHIAAGINLNFWPVGTLFRRGGAFFIRRSFSGNKLYSAVFREYLSQLFSKGYPVKYYSEGGRSRTGRLLQPKTGMLAMTVQAMLKGIDRPISLVPVYLGYEHVMEVNTYLKELKGSGKEKESIGGVFSAIRKLRDYGYGYVNFGQPIALTQFINQQQPEWRDSLSAEQGKPGWLNPLVATLADQLMRRVNQSAALNSINMIATVLLATRQHSLSRQELEKQLAFYQQLQQQAPYAASVTCAEGSAAQWIDHALKLRKIQQQHDSFGPIIQLTAEQTITMSYYRNNVSHLFVIPALLATALLQHHELSAVQLKNIIQLIQPLLADELFLQLDDLDLYLSQLLGCLQQAGLIQQQQGQFSAVPVQQAGHRMLELLAFNAQDILQRYAVVLNLLSGDPVSREELEQKSQDMAKRLNTLHGVSSPEYLDKNLFATLVNALKGAGYCQLTDNNALIAGSSAQPVQQTVNALLHADVLQTVLSIVKGH
ncbi:glycerol-3-phosphate 1-O-acyltransferase PlsB [Rheinheimera sp.]|uniref:glycerol-3-phosphate 1-O-acyltransferase PlsB n=1 Tax=Rheinheimera sp. TaxID=1869214 RepID=UPI00307DEB70